MLKCSWAFAFGWSFIENLVNACWDQRGGSDKVRVVRAGLAKMSIFSGENLVRLQVIDLLYAITVNSDRAGTSVAFKGLLRLTSLKKKSGVPHLFVWDIQSFLQRYSAAFLLGIVFNLN